MTVSPDDRVGGPELLAPGSPADRPAAVALSHVTRWYGVTAAVDDVSISFRSGECTALLGENGAGKSTLVRMISGLDQPSSGHMSLNGQRVRFRNPREALAAGVAIIPQELAYVPHLTVAENIAIGRWPQSGGLVSRRRMVVTAQDLIEDFGFDIDVNQQVERLPLAERQIVEIVKILAREPRLLLLDEPTASLTDTESARLLQVLKGLKKRGHALVYVSHRMDECFEIADHMAVLRSGKLVHQAATDDSDAAGVVKAMLGPDAELPPDAGAEEFVSNDVVLETVDWHSDRAPRVTGVSLALRAGEVVSLFGLLGSGVETVARGLAGHESHVSGSIRVRGCERAPFRSPHEALAAGIGYVPAERKASGIALNRPIRDNLTLQAFSMFTRWGYVKRNVERQLAVESLEGFGVSYGRLDQNIGELSGGNQQKVLLQSRLIVDPAVLVLHEPTRGVDIGARAQIHSALTAIARRGVAVLVVTSDVDEAVGVGDRLLVMRAGEIVRELSGAEKDRHSALHAAARSDSDNTQETK